jgi:hypothetical protein
MIRMLTVDDLGTIEELAKLKIKATKTDENVFSQGVFSEAGNLVFKHFVLPESTLGGQRLRCFGYYNVDGELTGVIGIRNHDTEPSWILSFIVTSVESKSSIQIIKELMAYVIEYQEEQGRFQWFVISKLSKFKAWQKLFGGARSSYHHYVYARVKANTMPKWLGALKISGNKLFPYEINISMYMSKKLCTSDDASDISFDESDHTFL